jgi:hypothetical protein
MTDSASTITAIENAILENETSTQNSINNNNLSITNSQPSNNRINENISTIISDPQSNSSNNDNNSNSTNSINNNNTYTNKDVNAHVIHDNKNTNKPIVTTATIISTQYIQEILNENELLLQAAMENYQCGRKTQCYKYQQRIQTNLMNLIQYVKESPKLT